MLHGEVKQTDKYQAFHRRVVTECVRLMGEQNREFFDKQCDYIEEFLADDEPNDVAISQQECLDG